MEPLIYAGDSFLTKELPLGSGSLCSLPIPARRNLPGVAAGPGVVGGQGPQLIFIHIHQLVIIHYTLVI